VIFMATEKMEVSVVDLFCGVGGLTHGFVRENLNVVAGIDTDETCRYAYEKNNGTKFILKSIEEVGGKELKKLLEKSRIKILIGCAPCQPFSRYNNQKSKKSDKKWGLLYEFTRIINEVKPDIVSMENVPDIQKHDVFQDFIANLRKNGYFIWWDVVNCADYGVPQNRKRLVLLASSFGPIELIRKTHKEGEKVTVRDAIGFLDPIKAGESSEKDPLHMSSGLSEINLKRISSTPPGGDWRDWPFDLVLECHKKESGKSYTDVYGRMRWDKPSPTMTTLCNGLGNGRFGHPEQNRAISLREAAILQSFPRNYRFFDPNDKLFVKNIARHIGNAVPVKLGRVIAKSIKVHILYHERDQ